MHRLPQLSRRTAIVVVLLALIIALLGYASWVHWSEPRYGGQTASYWFVSYRDTVAKRDLAAMNRYQYVGPLFNDMGTERHSPALKALRAMGEPGVTYLTKRVTSATFGISSLYRRSYPKLPPVIRETLPNPAQRDQERLEAIVALTIIGARGTSVTSSVSSYILEQAPASYFCARAIELLRDLQPPPEQMDELTTELLKHGRVSDMKAVIDRMQLRSPAVVKCIGEVLEKEGVTDMWSFLTLRAMQAHASPITPLLLRLLTSTNAEVRYQSVRTLETIGTNATEAIPALKACANDTSSMVQSAAKRAIEAITSTNSVAR
jgi:hypothetical protein